MLPLLGAAIGDTRVLEVKPGWRARPLSWAIVVAEPGSKKSPALDDATAPLQERQRQLHKAYEEALKSYDPQSGTDAPTLAQLFTTDATVEALAVLLEQNPRGLAFIKDDLTGWVHAMNQYKGGKGADRQHWLSLWNGAAVIVNRKARKKPIFLARPFVAVTGCLPPDVLGDLADARGRKDGFMDRLLFAFPEPMPITWTDAALSSKTQKEYAAVFAQLWSLEPAIADGSPEPVVRSFSPKAQAAFVAWLHTHYKELNNLATQYKKLNKPDLSEHLRGAYAKFDGICAGIALLLDEAWRASKEVPQAAADAQASVEEQSVLGAIKLMDYFKQHTKRVYTRIQISTEEKRIDQACAWLKGHNGTATLRDFVTYKVAGCKTSTVARRLFQELEILGRGTITPTTPANGGPTSYVFHLKEHKATPQ
jgi:hypothetical protein